MGLLYVLTELSVIKRRAFAVENVTNSKIDDIWRGWAIQEQWMTFADWILNFLEAIADVDICNFYTWI